MLHAAYVTVCIVCIRNHIGPLVPNFTIENDGVTSDEICLPDITDAFSDDSSFEGSLTSMSSNFDTDSDKNDTTMEECDLDYGGA